jgi:hypothetical protein
VAPIEGRQSRTKQATTLSTHDFIQSSKAGALYESYKYDTNYDQLVATFLYLVWRKSLRWTSLCLPIIPSALVSLLLPRLIVSMFGCSNTSSGRSSPVSNPEDNSLWRTSLYAINSKCFREPPSDLDSGHLIGHFGPFSPGFFPIGDFIGVGGVILEEADPRCLLRSVP